MVGLASPNYLQLVMQGKRNLSEEMAVRVAKTLGLSDAETRYFKGLVALTLSSSEDQKRLAQAEILCSVKELVSKEIPKTKVSVLSQWYHLVIRELVLLKDFEPSGEWISQKLRGLISPDEAERSLNALLKTGFLKIHEGRWVQSDPVLDTGDALEDWIAVKFHKDTLRIWSECLESAEKSQREFGLLNIPIDSEKIPELKERMRKFQNEIIGWLQDETSPDRIVQLGLYLIPISKG